MNATQVIKVIDDLGNSPEEIAEKLKNLGVKGVVDDNNYCVIANYLSDKFPNVPFDVNACEISYSDEEDISIPIKGMAVSTFIDNFDSCLYPFLEEDDGEVFEFD